MLDPITFVVYGREVGEGATPHLQGYLQCSKQITRRQISEMLPRAYVAVAKGSYKHNYDYCTKGGDFRVQGEPNLTANEKRKRSRDETCADIITMHKAKKTLSQISDEYPAYMRDIKELSFRRHTSRTTRPRVLYLYGCTGVGKSHSTQKVCEEQDVSFYFKPSGSH